MACAVADSGFFVVNGYVEISADDRVAALKKVVLPVFVLPMRPILIGMSLFLILNIYLCLRCIQFFFKFLARIF